MVGPMSRKSASESKKTLQAKHISDEQFRAALDVTRRAWGVSMSWEVADELGVPFKVALAKARSWMKRGLLDSNGCVCGCRGDWKSNE
jgi:hypothetical protein